MDVQQITTLGIVGIAFGSLGMHAYRHLRGSGSGHCPGCGECGRESRADLRPKPTATPLVTLGVGMPARRAGKNPAATE